MRIREKTITAACRTENGIEWTTLKVRQDEIESRRQDALPAPHFEDATPETLDTIQLPDELSESIKGDVTVALRTSDLLLRTMRFPTTDPAEISEMVGFQIDKYSPFPIDQLATAYEILDATDDEALVLMAATKRQGIDALGDAFEQKGVRIHSMDARVLGWLRLLHDETDLPEDDCFILVINDGIDFCIVVIVEGRPLAFRSLHIASDEPTAVDELVQEIGYTLTALDAEHELPAASRLQYWSHTPLPTPMREKLATQTGLRVETNTLDSLPPLSEGIIRRTLDHKHRVELIPREWIEHKERKQMNRKFSIIAAGITAVWLAVLLIFFSIYKVRDVKLANVKKEADAIAPTARQALENRQKLKALKVYTDRSDSSLECLREVTRLLPPGDVEFASFSYTKAKGVTLRGTAADDETVTEFFSTLSKSELFDRLKNQSVDNRTIKGVRRKVFSVSLDLPSTEEDT